MSPSPETVTLVAIDDDRQSLALIEDSLAQPGLRILTTDDPECGLGLIRKHRPQIVLIDLMMPSISGLEVLDKVVAIDPATDVILITAHFTSETAVEAIRNGACDYLEKPLSVDKLQERVDRLLLEAKLRQRVRLLDEEMVAAYRFQGIVGRSPLMLEVFARIRRVAPYFRTALISGETGTGKELVARALHRLGPVSSAPFVVANCAALPEHLVESELFGHVRGAFTGAVQDKAGMFETAHGGTLFLDEIGELPLSAQAKLLRALQQQEIQRVGATAVRKVNVRIVAASNRNLRRSAAGGDFREDLFYRLSMVELKLPPLAERKEDLPLLFRHFVDHFATLYGKTLEGLTRRAEAALLRYPWPGNVRELENTIGYASMMAESASIDVQDLPEQIRFTAATQAEGPAPEYPMVSVDEIQRIHARRVLELSGNDKVRAAAILGVSRATLYRLLSVKTIDTK